MMTLLCAVFSSAWGQYATVSVPYTVDFTKSIDQFVIEDINNNLGTVIWTQGSYGMTATTYVQLTGEEKKTNHEGESWLVSPIIDLAGISTPTLAITDQVNKYFGTIEEELEVCVREAGGQWKSLNIPYDKPSSTWGGWVDRVVDLSAYAGKKIQVGFHYIGHAATAGTYEVKSFSISSEVPVTKEEAGLSYEVGNYTITLGDAYTLPVLSNPNNLAVTYSSSNTNIATVDEQGTVTPLAAGQTTIKASAEETDKFKAGSASYLLVIKEKGQAGTDAYQLVTDASSLSAGDQIIIVNEEMTFALSTTQNSNNRAATDVVESNYSITPSNLVQTITLEGSAGQWYFNVGNAYLYAASTSGNQLKTEDNPDEKAMASITIDGGVATVLFNQWAENARTLMRFNPNNGNPIFSCYAPDKTTGTALRIFRNTATTTPLANPELSFSATNASAILGESFTAPTLNNPHGVTVTYSSSNEKVATVDASTGKVALVGAGETTITATSAASSTYSSGSASYTLTVSEPTIQTLANIAALSAQTEGGPYRVTFKNVVVTYVNGNYAYMQDASGAIVMYKSGHGLTAGQVLNGTAEVTYQVRNGNPQITALAGVSASDGTAPEPKTVAASAWSTPIATVLSQYFKVTGATITQDGNKYYVQLGSENVQLYGQGDARTISVPDLSTTYTIIGFPTLYNTTPELQIFVQPEAEGSTKADPEIAYESTEVTASYGEPFTSPTLSNPHSLVITYTSSNENVATVDANTGDVSLVGLGETTITASTMETDAYKAGHASYKLTVVVEVKDNDDRFTLVEDYSTLKAGDQIVLVGELIVEANEESGTEASTTYYGMSINQKANNRDAVEVTYNTDNSISGNTALQTITLEGAADEWLFNVGSGYLYAANSKSNWLRTEEVADDNAKASITKEGIVFKGENTRNQLRFNPNNGSPLFSCYASTSTTGSLAKIYRKVEQAVKTGDANGDGEVNITDVLVIINYILDRAPKDFVWKNSDVNKNGEVDLTDALIIVKDFLLQKQ